MWHTPLNGKRQRTAKKHECSMPQTQIETKTPEEICK